MKLKFDANLDFQNDARAAVIDLFEGQPPKRGEFEVSFVERYGQHEFTELGISNVLSISEDQILKNLREIQERNYIAKSNSLYSETNAYGFPNFSVEMETGTGKTYVYLRTIFELNQKYGFKKFIIVVPSVAIREGVLSSIQIMKEHFKGLYDNVPYDHFVYNSKDLSKVRQFAVSNEIQIMVINIQAFQKDAGEVTDYSKLTDEQRKKLNIIHQEQDKMSGRRPIEYVQATRPIVIIDEPQSVDNTSKSQKAIKTLKPLFALRYSATHINPYNLVYKLDPIKAYDMKLVKQIEVASIRKEESYQEVYFRLDSIGYAKNAKTPHAKATIREDKKGGPKEKKVTLKLGSDLSSMTNRSGYEDYTVSEISAAEGDQFIEFTNGKYFEIKQEEGGMQDDVLKTQIALTIEEHLKKEKKYKAKGIKVLSLFFIDKVANYRFYDSDGNPKRGKLAQWFEEEYQKLISGRYKDIIPYPVEELHDGYFSADRKKGKIVELKDTDGKRKGDEETYHLIMKDKERLLSNEEPLRFIFSHSALKEGWDNPNVFQICSLRDIGTERERRQTLGRGLRLPVSSDGERVFDENINRLTVIASETFEQYARGLQSDYENDCNIKFGRIEKIAFSRILAPENEEEIGQERSEEIWNVIRDAGYIDTVGDITDKFTPEIDGFKLDVGEELELMRAMITDTMKKYIFKNRIVNARERRQITYNKRVELNEDFKLLWEKINKKTRYSVEFDTEELVKRAVDKIKRMEEIKRVQILTESTEVDFSEAGIDSLKVKDQRLRYATGPTSLPDILAFLQRETELTRHTLVEILKKSGRLKEFTLNPQAFMTEVAKLINRSLHELVIDGIKYERIKGQEYEMRLFEIDEVEEYLSRLYEVKSKDDRTPYDYILWESEIEKEVAEKLDSSESVKFFCKLPRWFSVPTPVGTYNPDWAVVMEHDEKLYLVRETKTTKDRDLRRAKENQKIDCGKAHFEALGVDFKVATSIEDVIY